MNDLIDVSEEELTPKLKELALKFNLPAQLLRQAIAEERLERLNQQNRKRTHWIWKTVELYNGAGGLRDSLNAKWQNINIVCTLMLTITVPLGLSPPTSYFSSAHPTGLYKLFQTLMFISSIFSLAGIISNTLWVDMMNTFCPRESDIVFYVNCGAFDFPFGMMLGTLISAIFGFIVLMQENSDHNSYYVSICVGVVILAGFIYNLVILAYPLLLRNRRLLEPFQRASEWCNITEAAIKRSSEFPEELVPEICKQAGCKKDSTNETERNTAANKGQCTNKGDKDQSDENSSNDHNSGSGSSLVEMKSQTSSPRNENHKTYSSVTTNPLATTNT